MKKRLYIRLSSWGSVPVTTRGFCYATAHMTACACWFWASWTSVGAICAVEWWPEALKHFDPGWEKTKSKNTDLDAKNTNFRTDISYRALCWHLQHRYRRLSTMFHRQRETRTRRCLYCVQINTIRGLVCLILFGGLPGRSQWSCFQEKHQNECLLKVMIELCLLVTFFQNTWKIVSSSISPVSTSSVRYGPTSSSVWLR